MARTGDLRIRVNRAEMRALKGAAKALGGRPVATWARDTLLGAAKAAQPVKATPAPQKAPPVLRYGNGELVSRAPLIKTYDPDAT